MKTYPRDHLADSQRAIMDLMQPGTKVLEMGCATGYMTRYMSEDLGCKVTAVEINAEDAALAEPYAERVVVGDLTQPDTWEKLGSDYDYVIYADVLEHLADPWSALRKTAGLLKPGGRVFASIPNIAYYRFRRQLLFGKFEYAPYGIMDDSHLRFFTAKTARELFTKTRYVVEDFRCIQWRRRERWLGCICPRLVSQQFVIMAAPGDV